MAQLLEHAVNWNIPVLQVARATRVVPLVGHVTQLLEYAPASLVLVERSVIGLFT